MSRSGNSLHPQSYSITFSLNCKFIMIKLLIGKSGAGKDTLLKSLVKEGYKPIVAYTTRPMREGEKEGIDYFFVSAEEFEKLKDGQLTEYRSYNTLFDGNPAVWSYGTPIVDPKEDLVGIVDIKAALSFIDCYGPADIDITYIYVDDKERERRAKLRGTFSKEEWDRRLADDKNKFSYKAISNLIRKLGKPITAVDNNGETPIRRKLGYFKKGEKHVINKM